MARNIVERLEFNPYFWGILFVMIVTLLIAFGFILSPKNIEKKACDEIGGDVKTVRISEETLEGKKINERTIKVCILPNGTMLNKLVWVKVNL